MNKQGKTTIILSTILTMILLTSSIVILMPENVRIDIEERKTIYRVFIDGSWELGATEYVYLWDGSTKMRAKSRNLSYEIIGDITTITRIATWKDNITTYDVYTFDSTKDDIELVPLNHEVTCVNCVGKIISFEYRDLVDINETKSDVTSPQEFGNRMKIEWEEGNYYAKIFKQKTTSDKFILKYRPTENVEIYNVRMYDPKINTDDLFSDLVVNDIKGEAVFTLNNPSFDIPLSVLNISFNKVYGDIASWNLQIRGFCNETISTPIYEINETCNSFSRVNNITFVNESVTECYNKTTLIDYDVQVLNTLLCFKDTTVVKSGSHNYKLKADIIPEWNNGILGYSIDWIPDLTINGKNFKQYKWAWWNNSYSNRFIINCSFMTDGRPFVINGSSGVNIGGDVQYIWTTCEGINTSIYFNNQTDYVIANDLTQLPMEIEIGNVSSFNAQSVWGSEYEAVYHASNYSDSTGVYAGTNGGTAITSGKIGNAWDYSSGDDVIIGTTSQHKYLYAGTDFTVYLWTQIDTAEPDALYGLLTSTDGGGNRDGGYLAFDDRSGVPRNKALLCSINNDPGGQQAGCIDDNVYPNNTSYQLVTFVYSNGGNNFTTYINDAKVGETADSGNSFSTDNSQFVPTIGAFSGGTTFSWIGNLDEIQILQTVRTSVEVNQTYQNVIGTTGFGSIDDSEILVLNIAPIVILNTPLNESSTTDQTPNFTFNYTDAEGDNSSCELFINNTGHGTISNIVNGSNNNSITANVTISFGEYNWNVTCNDGTVDGTSNTYIITILNTPPIVILDSPEDGKSTYDITPTFGFNYSDFNNHSGDCDLIISGIKYGNNASVLSGSNQYLITANASIAIGNHIWYESCNDGFNTTNSSTRNITIISNIAPVTANVYIVPNETVNIFHILEGWCNVTDVDGDKISHEWIWYNNSDVFSSGNYSNIWSYQETANISTVTPIVATPTATGYLNATYNIPSNSSKIRWEVKHGTLSRYNISVPSSCFNSTIFKGRIRSIGNESNNMSTQPQCYNGGEWINIGTYEFTNYSSGSFSIDLVNGSNMFDGNWSSSSFKFRSSSDSSNWWNNGDTATGSWVYSLIYEEAVSFGVASATEGISLNINNLTSDNTAVGDNWTFSCRGFDGVAYGNWLNSSTVLINDLNISLVSGVNLSKWDFNVSKNSWVNFSNNFYAYNFSSDIVEPINQSVLNYSYRFNNTGGAGILQIKNNVTLNIDATSFYTLYYSLSNYSNRINISDGSWHNISVLSNDVLNISFFLDVIDNQIVSWQANTTSYFNFTGDFNISIIFQGGS